MTSPQECEADRGRRRTDVAPTGVETIIALVKSDAAATASADGCQMSPFAKGRARDIPPQNEWKAQIVTGFEAGQPSP
jgi:hypothetical protein